MRRLFAIALLAAVVGLPLASQGQARMGAGLSGAHWGAGSFARTHSGASFRFGDHRSFGDRRFAHQFFPSGYFFDTPLFADYSEAIPPQAPAVILVETAGPAAETKQQPVASEPLLIELQGDRYVRYGGRERNATRLENAPLDYAEAIGTRQESLNADRTKIQEIGADLPAILIFHDGRREEASNYAIVGGIMYVSSNFWSSGSWSKKIQLADLDLPATLRLNQERGVKFVLPGGPNEVVTRP